MLLTVIIYTRIVNMHCKKLIILIYKFLAITKKLAMTLHMEVNLEIKINGLHADQKVYLHLTLIEKVF